MTGAELIFNMIERDKQIAARVAENALEVFDTLNDMVSFIEGEMETHGYEWCPFCSEDLRGEHASTCRLIEANKLLDKLDGEDA